MNINNKMITNDDIFTNIPLKEGRYVVIDTETTGLNFLDNNVIEIAAIEVVNGKLTGQQFHGFLSPRFKINSSAEEKHHMNQEFYKTFYEDVYSSDKGVLETFLQFIGTSLIFAHNAAFDLRFINQELQHYDLQIIPKKRFRCTMKLFKNIISSSSPTKKYSLSVCCDHFKLVSSQVNFHSAIFDSFMTARVLCHLLDYHETMLNPETDLAIPLNEEKDKYITDSISETSGNSNEINKQTIDAPIQLDLGDIPNIFDVIDKEENIEKKE